MTSARCPELHASDVHPDFTLSAGPGVVGSGPPQSWDAQFRAIPDAAKIGEYMRRMSARPHHPGSPYDKDNAEWIAAC